MWEIHMLGMGNGASVHRTHPRLYTLVNEVAASVLIVLYRYTGGFPFNPGINKQENRFVFHIIGIVHNRVTAYLLGLFKQGLVSFTTSQYSAEPERGLTCCRDTFQNLKVTACQFVLSLTLNKPYLFSVNIGTPR